MQLKPYQQRLAELLAETGSLFFAEGLVLKDGRPTPYFFNLGVFRTGRLAWELGRAFAAWMAESGLARRTDVILGPSYKGSAIAQAAATALWLDHEIEVAYEYDRKEAKTHGEHAGGKAMFVTGALSPGARVLVLDDVGTSMATKVELLDKLAGLGLDLELLGVGLAVDRQQTQAVYDDAGQVVLGQRGPDALARFTEQTGLPVWSLLGIDQVVAHLRACGAPVLVDGRRQHLDDALARRIDEYLAVYGREARS